MTGFDVQWSTDPRSAEEQKTVMIVHFRPDKLPENKAQWFEWLGNYAHFMARLASCPKQDDPSREVKIE